MKKFRTYKHHVLIYDLQRDGNGFVLSIEKSCSEGTEKSSYLIFASECEMVQLTLRLWRSGVTPMSLVYILEDEGYLPIRYDEETIEENICAVKKNAQIIKRDRSKNTIKVKSFGDCVTPSEDMESEKSKEEAVKA